MIDIDRQTRHGSITAYVLYLTDLIRAGILEITSSGVFMQGKSIKAKEILADIKAGLAHEALKKKYGISSKGLQSVFKKLRAAGLLDTTSNGAKTVIAGELLRDIKAGVGRKELMAKHNLSLRQLQGLVTLMLDADELNRGELYDYFDDEEAIIPDNIRVSERFCLDFETPIYEPARPELAGRLIDITEEGVGVEGIESSINDIKKFVVLGDPFGEIEAFEFEAQCRWVKDAGSPSITAGFQIINISDTDFDQLRKLVQLVSFAE